MIFVLPIRLVNVANAREHWSVRKRRAAEQRGVAELFARQASRSLAVPHGVVVTITRIAPRRMDSDGAVIAGKHVRDGVAAAFDVDDGSSWWTWGYDQRKPRKDEQGLATGKYGVEVAIRPRTEAEAC